MKVLLLSHGQASVERGFSVNKELLQVNMQGRGIVAQGSICDYVDSCGGVLKVPITNELLKSCSSAGTRYRAWLKQQQEKANSEEQKKT